MAQRIPSECPVFFILGSLVVEFVESKALKGLFLSHDELPEFRWNSVNPAGPSENISSLFSAGVFKEDMNKLLA
jgi:hypothetical protein